MTAADPTGPRPAGPLRSLLLLAALRWRMVRPAGSRAGLAALCAAVPVGLVAAVVVAGELADQSTGSDRLVGVALVTPTLFLAFAVLAVLAPLAAGGGTELYPADQLVAFPVRPETVHLAALLLAPVNLAWTSQVFALFGVTSYLVDGPGRLPALVTVLCFVALATVAGQALAWLVVGVRATRRGRLAVWAGAAALAGAGLLLTATGQLVAALDRSPTTSVLLVAFGASRGDLAGWASGTALMCLLTGFAYAGGARACGWALGRAGDGHRRSDRAAAARRRPRRSAVAELVAVDRASVWRTAALRRGGYVLALLPGAVALVAGMEWAAITLLPGLVASGAGLLFGVNAFCLDAGGAVWLASLPHPPALTLRSKARVVTEVCAGTVAVAVAVAATRAIAPPTPSQAAGVLCATLVAPIVVVSVCLRLSVTRPRRADLRGPRETPAPPGAMAAYSLRLALVTTFTGLLLAIAGSTPRWWGPPAVALPLALASVVSLRRTARTWADPRTRARVVSTVASG